MTLSNSPMLEKLQVKLAFTSWDNGMLYAMERFECSQAASKKENYFIGFSKTLAEMHAL